MTLETYAAPLRSRPVDEIDTEAVLSVLSLDFSRGARFGAVKAVVYDRFWTV